MKRTCCLTLLLLAAASWAPTARAQSNPVPPIITNLVALQRTNTMTVDITYDLVDPDSPSVYIMVEASSDGGGAYFVPIRSLSGDVGLVAPGTSKKIVWNAWTDWANNYTTNAKVRIIADDTASAVPVPPITPPASNLVYIPSGSFNMSGSGTLVYLSRSYWMGKYEVTQGEYQDIMTNNPSSFKLGPNYPVEQMTRGEAMLYCARLTAREQAAGRIGTNQVYRLPTEAEWEYACRAGTTTTYSYGDDPYVTRLRYYAWYNENSDGVTHPTGVKVPNRWGLYDMMGNVTERCSDFYSSSLPGGNVVDPQGPTTGSYFVTRGGGWQEASHRLESNYRSLYYDGTVRLNYVGFRVVLYPAL